MLLGALFAINAVLFATIWHYVEHGRHRLGEAGIYAAAMVAAIMSWVNAFLAFEALALRSALGL